MNAPRLLVLSLSLAFGVRAEVPVAVKPVQGRSGMVVAGHPQAAAAGLEVLRAGGNAVDAAVATSLALGVAEPYGSGLGGKLMLLHFEAKTGKVTAIDAMDAAGSVDAARWVAMPSEERSTGYPSVCVPGLAAGLWTAHQRWGARPWAEVVRPAIELARKGFEILPKSREQFAEQEKKLRRGDAEIARLYLPGGQLPAVGSLLPNEDLARTMEIVAREGRDGFYKGAVARAIAQAARAGGGSITLADLEGYEARVTTTVSAEFRGYTLHSGPPPTSGSALFLPILKALENETSPLAPLRAAEHLDRLGRVWRAAQPAVARTVGDVPESIFLVEKLLAPDAIGELRAKAFGPAGAKRKVAAWEPPAAINPYYESAMAATTHFAVADRHGNIVCATQSQSLHFGAGVVPPGTGVVMNNSMMNFSTTNARSPNYVAAGKRPTSTIGPTIVLRGGRPVLAVGVPGSSRIPTALLQVLYDRLALGRPLAEAIGDTRVHFQSALRSNEQEALEAEQSLPAAVATALKERGWNVVLREPAGTGKHFGGVNAIEFNADGSLTGYADPRRTNAAAGY
jgi:gamma-glutamyltranspeptidase/glutathione hydrolase